MIPSTRHQLLRDRRLWLGALSGLSLNRNGDLLLARVPAPANGKAITVATTYPYARQVSGLALGPSDAVFVADTAHDRVLFVDGLCNSNAWLQGVGGFDSPRGLAITPDNLLVADSGRARLQSFALPLLEANVEWKWWAQPTSIAVDSQRRLLVVDAATSTVHRMLANRSVDAAFDLKIAAQGRLQKPLFIGCDADDRVLVSDSQANSVFVFSADGTFAFELTGPAGWQPGALASFGARVYVADAASGAILVFEHDGSVAQLIAEVNGYRGPVTALAAATNGDLFIKPGLDTTYYQFAADAAYIATGELIAGPFDAGEEREWERAWIEVQLLGAASIAADVVLKDTTAPPAAADWIGLPSFDALLAQLTHGNRRFIWLRLKLAAGSSQESPRLQQARAATATEDLRDYLPLTYRRNDKDADGFLSRWLKLVRGEFSRVEEYLEDMPRLADVNLLPASSLNWLAQWLAFELPQIANDDQRRALLARAVQLYSRRGTRQSIAEFVEIHTGIRPAIVEAFADRRVWVLGSSSCLDFDTRLPALDPMGMVVPDENAGGGCCPPIDAASSDCMPCSGGISDNGTDTPAVDTPIGRAIVGESGPLATYQMGLPLFAEEAYRFCVIVEGYRACDAQTRAEIARIVEREKPAHTDYRIEYVHPDMRIGMQARIGIDAIVGGDPPPLRLSATQLGIDTQLPPSDVARVGVAALDGMLTLT